MNHTKTSTLGIATAIAALAVIMVAATALTTGHNALAAKVKLEGNKVKVGYTKTIAIQAADNSQHCAFGAGSSTDSCDNHPSNSQSQTTNSGSTGSG
jgi:hypothetical protein